MGGDSFFPNTSSIEEESTIGQDFPHESIKSGFPSDRDDDDLENDDSIINGESGLNLQESSSLGPTISPISEATERKRLKVYADVLRNYEELQSRIGRLEEAKTRIWQYTPGSWVETAGGMSLDAYDVPNTTSLLLIGPKGSGKSSLVNRISRVFDDGLFVSGRAQVSYNYSNRGGTFFLHEYMIPRGSKSFCLYDTRSLSDDLSENLEMLKGWMMNGVRHGELIERRSDGVDFSTRFKYKVCKRRYSSNQVRPINFVIFVLNGLSVLESIYSDDEEKKRNSQMIATIFNDPCLSFKDDKPVVVVTHGDLLSISDRVKIRVYLGELLAVPPMQQIFDIPENNDAETALTIVDMLSYCLERADRNLPIKDLQMNELYRFRAWVSLVLIVLAMVPLLLRAYGTIRESSAPTDSSQMKVDWYKIRHMWFY